MICEASAGWHRKATYPSGRIKNAHSAWAANASCIFVCGSATTRTSAGNSKGRSASGTIAKRGSHPERPAARCARLSSGYDILPRFVQVRRKAATYADTAQSARSSTISQIRRIPRKALVRRLVCPSNTTNVRVSSVPPSIDRRIRRPAAMTRVPFMAGLSRTSP